MCNSQYQSIGMRYQGESSKPFDTEIDTQEISEFQEAFDLNG